jgi:hypothetical protein
MKKKLLLVGMISVALAFGFVLVSCTQVFEGDETVISGTAKLVTLTLTPSTYDIKYDGKTYNGSCAKTSFLGIDNYEWTSGGTGGVIVLGKEATFFSYRSDDKSVSIVADSLKSKSVVSGEISPDDIELIIIEE